MSKLREDVQQRARQTYKLWKENNLHPGLHFKQIHSKELIYSVRIGLSYRAVGAIQNNVIIWFWIRSHEEYNNLISNL